MKTLFTLLIVALLGLNAGQVNAQQLMNLDAPAGARFTLTEKTWPQNHGQADVCLWSDDKVAAFTVTIDDNNEQNIPFWESMHTKYGFSFTWFVINQADPQYNVKDWNNFVNLANAGHAVDGHDDRNWYNEGEEPDGWTNPTDAEYLARLQATKDKIDTELTATSNKCRAYAYPFGDGNVDVARQAFIAIRGVTGLLNKAEEVNYLDVNSVSSPHIASDPAKYVLPLVDDTKDLYGVNYYRGWGSTHFHAVDLQADQDAADALLQYIKDREDNIWVSTFQQVAAYGQSRDTHTLNVTGVTTSEVRFVLTDQMSDVYFNFPLTVKVRVNNTWTDATAVQNGQAVDAQLITHTDGNKYVLVKAVPDAGETTITGTVSAGSNTPPVLDAIGNQSVTEGEALNIDVTASDADGDALEITAANLPGFASLTDNGDGTALLSLSPDYGDAGTYNGISIAVSDGTDSHSEGIVVTVDASSHQVIVIKSSGVDGMVYDPSVSTVNNPYTNDVSYDTGIGMKLGSSDNGGGLALISDILVFELPERPVGKVITEGVVTVDINWKRQWVTGSFDLYGLPFSSNNAIAADMHYNGAFVADQNGTKGLQDNFWTAPAGGAIETPGSVSSSTEVSALIAEYINNQYDNGAEAGDFVFVRLSPAEDYTHNGNFVFITSGNSSDDTKKPKLSLTFGEATAINKTQRTENVDLYPNPSTGVFTVQYNGFEKGAEVLVLSIQGRVLYRNSVAGLQGETVVNANFPAGTYIVKISDNNKVVTKKLVVR